MTNFDNLIELVRIPAGEFLMGSPDDEPKSYTNEHPQHEVTVSEFFLGKYPVTQAQWRVVAELPKIEHDLDPDPSYLSGGTLPVAKVNWYEAVEFCNRLSQVTGREYRLPSEAEWEYACRAGTTTPFYFGDVITPDLANYGECRKQMTPTPVGSFPANGFGLHDMHGNVWEWCADNWHSNYKGAPTDGSAWKGQDVERVLRGGSWLLNPRVCRSAVRDCSIPGLASHYVGFRVCCSIEV